jgi:hypothetical protein
VQTETKISIIVALVLVLAAFFDLRIAAGIATIYLIVYAIRRLRKSRPR